MSYWMRGFTLALFIVGTSLGLGADASAQVPPGTIWPITITAPRRRGLQQGNKEHGVTVETKDFGARQAIAAWANEGIAISRYSSAIWDNGNGLSGPLSTLSARSVAEVPPRRVQFASPMVGEAIHHTRGGSHASRKWNRTDHEPGGAWPEPPAPASRGPVATT